MFCFTGPKLERYFVPRAIFKRLNSGTSSAPRSDLDEEILVFDLMHNGMRFGRTVGESECILHLEGI